MNFLKKYAKFFTVALIGAIIIQSAAIPVFADETDTVYLGGQPFGVKFFSDGIMITELEDFFSDGRYICPAREGGLAVGDVIKKVNGTKVANNEDLQLAAFGSFSAQRQRLFFGLENEGKSCTGRLTFYCRKVLPWERTEVYQAVDRALDIVEAKVAELCQEKASDFIILTNIFSYYKDKNT